MGEVIGMIAIVVLIVAIIGAVPIMLIITSESNKGSLKMALDSLTHTKDNLETNGFSITKRIALLECINNFDRITLISEGSGALSCIFFDYDNEQFAVGSPVVMSQLGTAKERFKKEENRFVISVKTYDFSELRSYEVLEDSSTIYKGGGIGYGPFVVARGGSTSKTKDLSVRISLGGKKGASSILFPVIDNFSAGIGQDTELYRSSMECVRAITDELRNIMQL